MSKSKAVLLSLFCFFFGVTLGIMISPATHGIGNNAGNTNNFYAYKKEDINDVLENNKVKEKE